MTKLIVLLVVISMLILGCEEEDKKPSAEYIKEVCEMEAACKSGDFPMEWCIAQNSENDKSCLDATYDWLECLYLNECERNPCNTEMHDSIDICTD
jgi:hypothetical protein